MTPKQWHRYYIKRSSFLAGQYNPDKSTCYVECGVKYGTTACIIGLQTNKKFGYLFDTWQGFPHYAIEDATNESRKRKLESRMHGISTRKHCKKILKKNGLRLRIQMLRGDICETVPKFADEHKDINIAYLHIDTDLHDPADTAFKYFGDSLSDNGIIFVHDYGDKHWPGVKTATNKFLEKHPKLFPFEFPKDQLFCLLIFKNKEMHREWSKIFERINR
tara:strand:- start:1262 stop:1918 length:657 start_codon:yes stop_codon:yes gene_type:complete